jgi:hypothetical protein
MFAVFNPLGVLLHLLHATHRKFCNSEKLFRIRSRSRDSKTQVPTTLCHSVETMSYPLAFNVSNGAPFPTDIGREFIFLAFEDFCIEHDDAVLSSDKIYYVQLIRTAKKLCHELETRHMFRQPSPKLWKEVEESGILQGAEVYSKTKQTTNGSMLALIVSSEFLNMAQQVAHLGRALVQAEPVSEEEFKTWLDALNPRTFGSQGAFVPDNDQSFKHQQKAYMWIYLMSVEHMWTCFKACVQLQMKFFPSEFIKPIPDWWKKCLKYPYQYLTDLIRMGRVECQPVLDYCKAIQPNVENGSI